MDRIPEREPRRKAGCVEEKCLLPKKAKPPRPSDYLRDLLESQWSWKRTSIMDVVQTLKEVLLQFWLGLVDCFTGVRKAANLFTQSSRASSRLRSIIALNVMAIVLVDLGVRFASEPLIRLFLQVIVWLGQLLKLLEPEGAAGILSLAGPLGKLLENIVRILWVLPAYVVTKGPNMVWYNDIANEAHQARVEVRGTKLPNPGAVLADFLFSVVLTVIIVVQTMVMLYVPIAGSLLYFFHQALASALFSFEYAWFARGILVQMRVSKLQTYWPYYVGFGTPLALLTMIQMPVLASSALYAAVFPVFIVAATLTASRKKTAMRPLPLFAAAVGCCAVVRRFILYFGLFGSRWEVSQPSEHQSRQWRFETAPPE